MATFSLVQFLFVGNAIHQLSNTNTGWSGAGTTDCAGTQITGGYQDFGEKSTATKTFTLPEHFKIAITVTFYAIDSWDTERMVLEIDGQTKVDTKFQHSDGSDIWLCGIPDFGEHVYKYQSEWFDHTSLTIDFKVQSFLDQSLNDESLGWNTKIEYQVNECFYLYSESNYAGNEYKFCLLQPKRSQSEILDEILSIKIPNNSQLILQGADFNGGILTTFTTNQPNLIQPFKFTKQMMIP